MGRASDETREHAVTSLRAGLLDGRLGTETFVRRVDAAYNAKTHDVLTALTSDLPRRRQPLRVLLDLLAPRQELSVDVPLPLKPPDIAAGEHRVLGRDQECDYVVDDRTVSSRHAELERREDGWLIRDLGSRNGTRVNGWRITQQQIRAGDTVALGGTMFVFVPPTGAAVD